MSKCVLKWANAEQNNTFETEKNNKSVQNLNERKQNENTSTTWGRLRMDDGTWIWRSAKNGSFYMWHLWDYFYIVIFMYVIQIKCWNWFILMLCLEIRENQQKKLWKKLCAQSKQKYVLLAQG